MVLDKKQEQAVDLTLKRYKDKEKYTVIAGVAGSGKSTCVKFIVAALGNLGLDSEEDIGYCAPTGKAAVELSKKGIKNVTTIHKLLYDWRPLPDGIHFHREEVEKLPYKVVIVDETGMVEKEMVDKLLSYDIYVIFCGDNQQLPPVNKEADNHLLDSPHIFLDEVHRQALDSDILRLSQDIRLGKPIIASEYCGKDVMILPKKELSVGMMTWADNILCATNKTRTTINSQMRKIAGHTSENPEDGDKIICLSNYWETFDDGGNPLVNGTIGYLRQPNQVLEELPKHLSGKTLDITEGHFETETGAYFYDLPMDTNMILTGQACLDPKTAYKVRKYKRKTNPIVMPMAFTYGYCITCHKAQGSTIPKVLVLEENFPFDAEEHRRWLYTACTRASENLVLLR